MAREHHVINGGNLLLRSIRATDLEMMRCWRNREDVRIWFKDPGIISPEQQQAWYATYRANESDFMFIIEDTQDFRGPVGTVAIYRINKTAGTAEFGRLVNGEAQLRNRGLAARASYLACKWAFEELCVSTLTLWVKKNNVPAIRVYRRIGFLETSRTAPSVEDEGLTMVLSREQLKCD